MCVPVTTKELLAEDAIRPAMAIYEGLVRCDLRQYVEKPYPDTAKILVCADADPELKDHIEIALGPVNVIVSAAQFRELREAISRIDRPDLNGE